tara:strand:+ start:2556 stop:3227 length:672 start_codon:yes stop_codon:yes gene_type:complete
MGGSGSALAMIQSIKDNRALLGRRRSYFKAKIEAQQAAEKLNITYGKATPEQLRLIRRKLKKQRFFLRFRVFVLLLLLSPFFGYMVLNMWEIIEEEIPRTEGQVLIEYYSKIKKGDEYFKKKQIDFAMEMYRHADRLRRETYVVDYRQALASTYKCLLYNKGCGSASGQINYLYRNDSTNMDVIKLNRLLVNAYNFNNQESLVSIEIPNKVEWSIYDKFIDNQ